MRIEIFIGLNVLFFAFPNVGFSKDCGDFGAKLSTCTPYKCTFIHPIVRGKMEKTIVGFQNNKCIYYEQMPNGGKMTCALTKDSLKAVVQYEKDTQTAMAAGKRQDVHVEMKNGVTQTTYAIDGKLVENPMQEALDSAQCVISGYEDR